MDFSVFGCSFFSLNFQYNFILFWINPRLILILLYTHNDVLPVKMFIFSFLCHLLFHLHLICASFYHFLIFFEYLLLTSCDTILSRDQMYQKIHQFHLLSISPIYFNLDWLPSGQLHGCWPEIALLSLTIPFSSLLCCILCSLEPTSISFLDFPPFFWLKDVF